MEHQVVLCSAVLDCPLCCPLKVSVGEKGSGFHSEVAEELKLKQYAEQFPDFKQSSDPSLVILCMERHGS